MTQEKNETKWFYMNQVICKEKETVFMLDRPKQGCDKIIFQFVVGSQLKDKLYDVFNKGGSFDFNISKKLENGYCEIDTLKIPFGSYVEKLEVEALDDSARDRSGPFVTHLCSYTIAGNSHYFRTDDPAQVGGYVWLRLYYQEPLVGLVKQAFDGGKKVKVMLGYPYTNMIDNNPAATIHQAEIIFE